MNLDRALENAVLDAHSTNKSMHVFHSKDNGWMCALVDPYNDYIIPGDFIVHPNGDIHAIPIQSDVVCGC
jgi:hypothetical protein